MSTVSAPTPSLEFAQHIEPLVRVYKVVPVSIQLRRRVRDHQSEDGQQVVVNVVRCYDNSEFENVQIVASNEKEESGTYDYNSAVSAGSNSLTVSLRDNYSMQLLLKFSETSIYKQHQQLKIKVTPIEMHSQQIAPIESHPFNVVDYYLHIDTDMPSPYIFFKDIGGKDSGIPIEVTLRKSNSSDEKEDHIVRNRKLTIKPVLKYESGQSVPDQTILKSINEMHNFTITESGTTSLKFRINEVSSKHRNEKFIIVMEHFLTAHDASPFVDIAPGRSVPLEIRSKLNHNSVKKREAAKNGSAYYGEPGHTYYMESSNASLKRPREERYDMLPASKVPYPAPGLVDSSTNNSSPAPLMSGGPLPPFCIEDLQDIYQVFQQFKTEVEKLTIMSRFTPSNVSAEWCKELSTRAHTVDEIMKSCEPQLNKLKGLKDALATSTANRDSITTISNPAGNNVNSTVLSTSAAAITSIVPSSLPPSLSATRPFSGNAGFSSYNSSPPFASDFQNRIPLTAAFTTSSPSLSMPQSLNLPVRSTTNVPRSAFHQSLLGQSSSMIKSTPLTLERLPRNPSATVNKPYWPPPSNQNALLTNNSNTQPSRIGDDRLAFLADVASDNKHD